MFGSSAIYPRFSFFSKEELFRMIDHMMIYLVIAGSISHLCHCSRRRVEAWDVTGRMVLAVAGILKVFGLMLPLVFYGFVSINGLVVCYHFPSNMGCCTKSVFILDYYWWLILHNRSNYLRPSKPNPAPSWFGYHGIWHLLLWEDLSSFLGNI